MNELITVVLPIYNVEKYLEYCIESVLKQTYKNIEIILVDDGSPDNCARICDEYEKKDARVKAIHKKNGGLSDARNEGLRNEKVRYICFIDSDDFIKENYIEILYNLIKKNNADMAVGNFIRVQDSNFPKITKENIKETIYTGKEMNKMRHKKQ